MSEIIHKKKNEMEHTFRTCTNILSYKNLHFELKSADQIPRNSVYCMNFVDTEKGKRIIK